MTQQIKSRRSGLYVLVTWLLLFAPNYPEIKVIIGFIPYDVYVNKCQIHFNRIYKANQPLVEFANICYYYDFERAVQPLQKAMFIYDQYTVNFAVFEDLCYILFLVFITHINILRVIRQPYRLPRF